MSLFTKERGRVMPDRHSTTHVLRCFVVAVTIASIPRAAAGSGPCNRVEGADALLAPGKVVLLGEQHGTEESPAFVLDLVCLAAAAELPVRLGIEISDSEQSRVDLFLDSAGNAANRALLLEGSPWQAQTQYGVTSDAMARLLDGARKLRQAGSTVDVVLFNRSGAGGGQARDRRMAEYLAAVAGESTEAAVIVLTGNIHSRVTRGTRFSAGYEPMGYLLSQAVPPERIVALDVAHEGGTAWVCVAGEDGCGPQRLRARGPDGNGVTLNDSPEGTGHHGWYHVGAITASPPAKETDGEGPAEVLWEFETGG
jgi:hypothetical protein